MYNMNKMIGEVHIWFLLFVTYSVIIPCLCFPRTSDTAITNDDSGILMCGSIMCPNGTMVCVVKKKTTDDLKNITRKSICLSANGTNLAELNLTEPNPAGLVVNVSSSSIIGPAFDAAIPSISIPAPPSYTPSYIPTYSLPQPTQPQQPNMQQTINDIIASITNAITQSSNPPVPFASPPVAPQSPVAVISVMSPAAVTAAAPAPVPVPFAVPVFAPAPPPVYVYPTPVLNVYSYIPPPPPPSNQVVTFEGMLHSALDFSGDYYPNPWQQQPEFWG